ncbi:MAG: Trp biosynthesis-associated membrane protein [Actinomycetota bacterium]|jgi:hypothetical protein|nr:Trp biosynthesis-associated membrane protein [Actinomycetota bacterium]
MAVGLLGGGLVAVGGREPWRTPVPGPAGDQVAPAGSLVVTLGAVILLGMLVVAVTRTTGRRVAGLIVALAAVLVVAVAVLADGAWTLWRTGVLLGASLALGAGALAAARGPAWAAMSQRYDAPGASEDRHQSDPWRALDRGEDPTL